MSKVNRGDGVIEFINPNRCEAYEGVRISCLALIQCIIFNLGSLPSL